jgi:hypothetical protein
VSLEAFAAGPAEPAAPAESAGPAAPAKLVIDTTDTSLGTGGALARRGGARRLPGSAALGAVGEFFTRQKVPVGVKSAFLAAGFALCVAAYSVTMWLVSRGSIASPMSAAMAFVVLYVLGWTWVFLKWGTSLASGMTVALLVGHFAALYFVLMFAVRGMSADPEPGQSAEEAKNKRAERLTVRVYTAWLLASLAVAFT